MSSRYKLCLGTIFKLLGFLVNHGEQKALYKALFLVDGDPEYINKNNVSLQKAGSRQITGEYVNHIKQIGIDELRREYRRTLPRLIGKDRRASVILALKEIVSNDDSLDGKEIGKPEYTKESFLAMTTFDFYDVISSFVYYGCCINSDGYGSFVAKITGKILNRGNEEIRSIKLKSDTITEVPSQIPLSAVTEDFSKTFTEIKLSDYSIDIQGLNKIRLFRLKTSNNRFRITSLEDFLGNQLDHYLLSRARWRKLVDERKTVQLAKEAKKALAGMGAQEAFSQLMLYSFMECALHAPKIFNAIDKINRFGENQKSSGTYFIPKGTIDNDAHNHLVYGSAKVEDDLLAGLDNALAQSNLIIVNLSHERTSIENFLLDQATANTLFTDEEIDSLKKVIIPSETENDEMAIDSLGVFVCYSTDAISNVMSVPLSDADKLLDSYLDKEILSCLPHLEDLLRRYGLANKDIFLFFLPLEKATEDSNTVISTLKESI